MSETPLKDQQSAAKPDSRHRAISLKARIVSFVIALVLIPLGFVTYWTLELLESSQSQSRLTALDNAVEEARDSARFVERRSVTSAMVLSRHFLVEEFVRLTREGTPDYENQLLTVTLSVLGDFQQVHVDHVAIGILDPRGRVEAAKGPEQALQAIITEPRREAIAQGEQYREWLQCPGETSPCLLISNPIKPAQFETSESKKSAGYLAVLVSSENFRNIGARFTENFGGELRIVNDRGADWFKPNAALVLPESATEAAILVDRGIGQSYLRTMKVSDNLHVAGYLPAFDNRNSRLFLNALAAFATAGVILCVVTVLLALRRYVFSPLDVLKRSADSMAAGNLQATIPVLREDEIGDLGHALQRMQHRVLESNNQIRELAFTDKLTGLQNRAMFAQTLDFILHRSNPSIDCHALLFLDLDKFKQINDSLGHAVGDEMLQQFSERLVSLLTDFTRNELSISDFEVARFGGDEFQILLHGIDSSDRAAAVAQLILENLAEPFEIEGQSLYAPASIGISIYPGDARDPETLIKYADIAMYFAKKKGGNSVTFYSEELNEKASGKLDMQMRLREAIKNDRLTLHFQPKIAMKDGALAGAEVLCRWEDSKLGNVPPDRFIRVAENHGMIGALTEWVIDNACAQLAEWQDKLPKNFMLAMNASSHDVHDDRLPEIVLSAAKRHGINPKSLIIELTETGLIRSLHNPITNLEAIRTSGPKISLDDFGTGYSSLSYLRELPIDELKLDRSFLEDVPGERKAQSIVRVVAELAKALNLEWTAEGIERKEQLTALKTMGCSYAQGYLLAKPMNAEDFEKLLDNPREAPWKFFWKRTSAKAPKRIA